MKNHIQKLIGNFSYRRKTIIIILIIICINYINNNKYNKNDNMTKELVW